MKKLISLLAFLTLTPITTQSIAQISVSMGQPGFYGRIDIGGYPQPALIYGKPIRGHAGIYSGPPVYMHVPPGHARRWNHYCSYYNACNLMVYFVQPSWYNNVYVGHTAAHHAYIPAPIYASPPHYSPHRHKHHHHGHHFHEGHHHYDGHGRQHKGHHHKHKHGGHGRHGHDRH